MTGQQINRDRLRALAEKATPGPWEAEWCLDDGTLTVSAGSARTGQDGDPPGSYYSTDRILEWDDVWPEDGGEQREADAKFIAAARTTLPALLDALDQAEAEVRKAQAEVRKAQAEAWSDCVSEASALGWIHAPAALDMLERNPYEAEG